MDIILLDVMIVWYGLLPIGSIIFYSFVLAKILKSNTIKSDKRKKIFLLTPVPVISLVLLDSFSAMIGGEGIGAIIMFIFSFPFQIALICSIFLAIKLSKENVVIKEWFDEYKISYIASCIGAIPALLWIILVIRGFVVYGVW